MSIFLQNSKSSAKKKKCVDLVIWTNSPVRKRHVTKTHKNKGSQGMKTKSVKKKKKWGLDAQILSFLWSNSIRDSKTWSTDNFELKTILLFFLCLSLFSSISVATHHKSILDFDFCDKKLPKILCIQVFIQAWLLLISHWRLEYTIYIRNICQLHTLKKKLAHFPISGNCLLEC